MDFLEFCKEVVKLFSREGMNVTLETVMNSNEWKEDFDNDVNPAQAVKAVLSSF